MSAQEYEAMRAISRMVERAAYAVVIADEDMSLGRKAEAEWGRAAAAQNLQQALKAFDNPVLARMLGRMK